jgi:putative ABC transport system permease protein
VAKRIERETGLRAFTDEAFVNSTLLWWLKNTGVPGSFLTTVAFCLLFGLTVNGFIFSNYVSQHWRIFASLRAMGATGWQLIRMLLAQSLSLCLLCFCMGTLGAVLFGMAVKPAGLPPFLLTWEIVGGVLVAQVMVGFVGPVMSLLKLHRLQPEEAFRNG